MKAANFSSCLSSSNLRGTGRITLKSCRRGRLRQHVWHFIVCMSDLDFESFLLSEEVSFSFLSCLAGVVVLVVMKLVVDLLSLSLPLLLTWLL